MPSKTFSVDFETSGFRRASKQMNEISDDADDAGSSLQTAGKVGAAAIAGITTAVTAAAAGVGALIKETTEYARQVDNAAEQTGMAVESIQEIAYVADQVSGTNFDTVRDGLKELAIRSEEAANGTGEAQEAFQQLGISQSELEGMNTAETFRRVRQELQGASKQTRIFASEMIFGGEAGEKLVETLGLSADEMQRLRKQAQASGQVLSQQQVQALETTRQSWNRLTSSVSGFGRQIAAQMAPVVTGTVIPAIRSMARAVRDTVKAITSLSNTTKGIIATVSGLTAAVSAGFAVWAAWPAIIGAVSTAFGALTTAATTAWTVITSPITGVIAAIAAVAASAYLIYDNWGAVTDFFASLWNAVTTSAEAFGEVLVNLFSRAWLEVKKLFAQSINGLISLINQGLRAIGAEDMQIEGEVGVPTQALKENKKRLRKLQEDLKNATSQGVDDILQSGGEMMSGFEQTVKESYKSVKSMMSDIGSIFSFEGAGEVPTPGGSQTAGGEGASLEANPGGDVPAAGTTPSVSPGQINTLAPMNIPKVKEGLSQVEVAGKQATNSIARGFNQIASGVGQAVTQMFEGKNAFKSFASSAVRALKKVLAQLVALIPKLAIIKGIGAIAGISTGGITTIGGVLSEAIPFLDTGGKILSDGIAKVHEGETVLPDSFTPRGGGGVQGGTLKASIGLDELIFRLEQRRAHNSA